MIISTPIFVKTHSVTGFLKLLRIRINFISLLLVLLGVYSLFLPSVSLAASGDENWDASFSLAGFDGSVSQVETDSQGNVYVAGNFSHVDGLEVNGLARWDGTAWDGLGVESGSNGDIAVAADDILYVAGVSVTGNGYYDIASFDGATWSDLSIGLPGSYGEFTTLQVAGNGILYAGGFRYINDVSQYGVYSFDGSIWSLLGDAFYFPAYGYAQISHIEIDGSGNVIVGGFFEKIGATTVNSVASWNGTVWSAMGAGVTFNYSGVSEPGSIQSMVIDSSGIPYFSGNFDRVDGVSVTGTPIVRWASGTWDQPYIGASEVIDNIQSMAFNASGVIYVAGRISSAVENSVLSWSGAQWVSVGQPFDGGKSRSWVESLTFANNGTLYAAGEISGSVNGDRFNGLAEFDGTDWTALTTHSGLGANGRINEIVQVANGDVLIGGNFTSIGGKQIGGIARWDGLNWWPLSGSSAFRLIRVNSIAIASNGDVFASGEFTDEASGIYLNIARWNGSAWFELGGSLGGSMSDLAFDANGTLYVAGVQYIGSNSINNIASWDGSVWSEVGGGVTDSSGYTQVNELEVTAAGELIAAGRFTQAGNVAALNVAMWDGISWSAIGTGLDSGYFGVYDIVELPDGGLAAAGQFAANSAIDATLAIWDDLSWSPIDAPNSNANRGRALALDAQGNIIVAGDFVLSYDEPRSSSIAVWDGVQWSGYGSGIPSGPSVNSLLTLEDGSIFVGGEFLKAGGKPSSRIARWIAPVTPGSDLCNGLTVTVDISLGQTATSGNDVILGTSGDDLISAFGGNDTICGLEGNDTIFAGNGDDWVDAGAGNDEVQGSNGTDTIYGRLGDDSLYGGPGNDSLDGEVGDDVLYGNKGDDTINGGPGVDEIRGGSGNDDIATGSGATVGSGVYVDGGAGDDTITGGPDADEIRGSTDQDTVIGGDGDDMLYGGSGEDEVRGDAGDDLMRGNAGNDVLTGGSGNDNINGYGSRDTIRGGPGNDVLDGSTGNDYIEGEAGDDTIRGGGGNDQLFGDGGVDNLAGGGGNDAMDGGSGAPDVCDGQSGDDTADVSCETILNTP